MAGYLYYARGLPENPYATASSNGECQNNT